MIEVFNTCNRGEWTTAGKDTQYKIEGDILYFQCSASKLDWKGNFNFWAKPYRDMKEKFFVHRGFLKRWKLVRKEIQKHYGSIKRIVGYSHGASLALLAHEDYLFITGSQPETIVFGCPKTFYKPKKVVDRFSNVKRFTSKGDIVTKVPPFYSHVGTEILLDKKVTRNEKLLVFITKHSPDVYKQRLV